MIGEDLLRYNKKQRYFLEDYETEGLNLYFSRPWQTAWMIFSLEEGIIEESDNYPWWPDLNVTAGAAIITKFNYNDYKAKAKDPKEILKIHDERLYDPSMIVIQHNGLRFDTHVHCTYRRLMGQKRDLSFMNRYIDTSQLIRGDKLGYKPDRNNFLSWMYKVSNVRKTGLKSNGKSVGEELGIEHDYDNLHDAICDNRLIHKIFLKYIWKVEL